MKLAVGADHAGFDLKSQIVPWLELSGHEVVDVGAHALDPADDYPDFAAAVAQSVNNGQAERGVMVCGSGVGASIATNNMNVLCLGGRVIGIETAKEVITAFVGAEFTAEDRFQRRIDKVSAIERNQD